MHIHDRCALNVQTGLGFILIIQERLRAESFWKPFLVPSCCFYFPILSLLMITSQVSELRIISIHTIHGFAWIDACLLCVYLGLSTHSARRPGHLNSPIQFPSLQNVCLKMWHDCQCKLTWGGCHRDMCLARSCCPTSAAAYLLESRLQPSPALVGEEGKGAHPWGFRGQHQTD